MPDLATEVRNNPNMGIAQGYSYFDGGVLELLGINLVTWLLSIVTLGIAVPWLICLKHNWITNHTVVQGKRLAFDGTGLGLFGTWIKIFLLTIITIGIYGFWAEITLRKWIVKHTYFA